MLPAPFRRLFAVMAALIALLVVIAPTSAGRAWCRADPVLLINGDVVDIQVGSSPEMSGAATGPIEMVVSVPRGTRANVVLNDFGFGRGYSIKTEQVDGLPKGVRASVAVRAPASNGDLPVSVYGTRVSVDVAGLLKLRPNLLWAGQAQGSANGWVVLEVR